MATNDLIKTYIIDKIIVISPPGANTISRKIIIRVSHGYRDHDNLIACDSRMFAHDIGLLNTLSIGNTTNTELPGRKYNTISQGATSKVRDARRFIYFYRRLKPVK